MKKIKIFLLQSRNKMMNKIFILISCTAILCSLFFCSKQNSIETIIIKVDIEEMAQLYLSDFDLLRKRSDSLETEYVFKRESDSVDVFITIGLYPSAEDAENAANEDFSYMAIIMEEGPHQGVLIGDKYWWWTPFQNSNIILNIVFIRENALFIMSCSHSYGELKPLAKKIDDDIIKKESYITFRN
jgi:hypothetical protein